MGSIDQSSSVFSPIKAIPYDEAYRVTAALAADKTADKVDLGAGVYKADDGKSWTLPSVKEAISRLPDDHTYIPQAGLAPFIKGAQSLLFGELSEEQQSRISSIQTVSGTHACHVGTMFLIKNGLKPKNVFISDPSWMNHALIWECADSSINRKLYPYYHAATKSLDFEGMTACLENESVPGDVVILQTCAHNPTGLDPTKEQWMAIADLCERRKLFPFFDCAYQGFATGNFDEDAWAVRYFASRPSMELGVAQSFSKNFGLYGERVGAFHILASDGAVKPAVQSRLVRVVRSEVSSGTAFGSRIVTIVLGDESLKQQFLEENKAMSSRIKSMRAALLRELELLGTPGNWSHITSQIGMFSYTGLTAQQVQILQEKHHIFLFSSGRASISGLNSTNVKRVAEAIHSVVAEVDHNLGICSDPASTYVKGFIQAHKQVS
ncbi:PLP-dependent transferase [Cryphonectria parasitica EP155]|uniref:Aspartate aminotransferase n=1 Tax=Cryphonectria parasitica (strain ATCC 38755 / EP155) TaxID=660469 RepID=A0A9P5CM80_CRYP1|nr:PLP-dependent transferase [Cryphonectria parasitica EP155]KAF3762590.1 PLP-dependent transferase [Cryphonectria parasitica EP155]